MKMLKYFLIMSLTFFPFVLIAQQNQRFVGSWMGKLNVGAIELRLGINLKTDSTGLIHTTLDSPDQNAYGLKTDSTNINGNIVTIEAKNMMARFVGTLLAGDSAINGTWSQGGKIFDLNLKKLQRPIIINRPQEPKQPFPYKSEEVKFTNIKANIELAGTLTLPQGEGPFPAVVLVTGSGPQNRDETLMGHKPFLVISDFLTRHGIAVLRYDDRGIGKSKGSFSLATSFDFADDAEAGFMWLKQQPLIDKNRTGIAGHSEGGLIAPIVASRNKNVDFIILIAGTGVSGEDIILAQAQLIGLKSGGSPEALKENDLFSRKLYSAIKKEPNNDKAIPELTKIYEEGIDNSKFLDDKVKVLQKKQMNSLLLQITSPWFRTFLQLDPKPYLLKTKCQVLAMNGTKDLQVPCDLNLNAIDKYLKLAGNKHYKILKIDGVNHLFQHCEKGIPAEYSAIEETFAPEALNAMSDFILHLKK
ncbi:MAG: alpha/beta hydrolase [Bacteroidetes bacterium]|nr:alpha/beta hydrolase [Bacteroidota bacterium]